ncbi:MAG: glycosyltransferase family 9 protein, partial [Gemmatimonadetes bacterium]|nr:glycosyltransferase family 9 protein [Gemmatimonadota bacterium]
MNARSPRTILIIRLGRLGDLVLTAAMTRETKRAFPGAAVTFVTAPVYESVAQLLPGVDTVVAIPKTGLSELREKVAASLPDSFDWIIDLHGNARSKTIAGTLRADRRSTYPKDTVRRRILVWFKRGRGKGEPVWRRYLAPLEKAGVTPEYSPPALLRASGGGLPGAIVLAPGAGRPTKQWPVNNFRSLARNLLEAFPTRPIVLAGGPGEEGLIAQIDPGEPYRVHTLLAAPFPALAAHLQDASIV